MQQPLFPVEYKANKRQRAGLASRSFQGKKHP
jgi:hypothetical protein